MRDEKLVLRVAVIHGGRILEERHLERDAFTVGTSPSATLCVPSAEIPERTTVLTAPNARALLLGASGRVSIGDVLVVYQVVKPRPAPVREALPPGSRGLLAQVDRAFLAVVALSFAAHLAGAGYVWSQPTPVEAELPLELEHNRFAAVMMPRLPPPPPSLNAAPTTPKDVPAPAPERVRPRAAPKPMAQLGLLGVIGAKGNAGVFGDLLATSSGVNDVRAALQGADGKLVVARESFDLSQRGAEQGEATTVRIDSERVQHVELGAKADATVRGVLHDEPIETDTTDVPADELTRWMRSRRGALQSCYERALKHQPTLAGRMVLKFSITSRGRVANVNVDEGSLPSAEVRQCVTSLARGWVLPFTPEDEVSVSFPFVFAPVR